ncbi:LamG-like jellyroll fold domain-containing protein [Streptomyces sp. NPDC048659]|uniref:LamG-like jellyroll fold domain-containing protein n=1 Tax=Streptomyces sp. NPDC048659 TaxID=3155489 RepID=UPI00341B5CB5
MTATGLSAQAVAASAPVGSEPEFPATPVSSPAADDAGRGKSFWQGGPLPEASAEQAASRKAAETGQRVPIDSLTSENGMVFANSDGTFTAETSPTVERVLKSGRWTPVDTTLVRRADGLLEPKAGQDLTVSGGGTGPLARMAKDGLTYELGSPWALPKPTVTGPTAVYASVRPGVDLVVQVRPDGFTQNLVVHDRAAAADPALKSVRFPVTTHGLDMRETGAGNMSLVDKRGRAVFSSSGALMWDSGKQPVTRAAKTTAMAPTAPAAAAAVEPAPEARTAVADVTVSRDALSVTPDQGFLADSATAYPVVIDPPAVAASLTGWTTVWSNSASTSFWKTSHSLGVGYDAWVDNKKARSLFQFDTRRVAGKKILNATFTPYAIWSANCTKKNVELWRTGAISSGTTFAKQPAWSAKVDTVLAAKGYDSNCPDGDIEFDATSAVAFTAKANATTTTLGLRADESDAIAWKQFLSPADPDATASRKPRLSITYVSLPDATPSYVKLADPNLACSAASSPAGIRKTTPRLTATPTSTDGSNASLRPNFEVFDSANAKVASLSPGTWTASATAGSVTTAALTDGKTYSFAARTEYRYTYGGATTSLYGPWSARCYFSVDTKVPDPPTVTGSPYTECAGENCEKDPELGSVGMTGTFTITTPNTDVRRFKTELNGVVIDDKTYTSNTKTHTVRVAPSKKGLTTLRATTYDAAGNVSAPVDYRFNVAAGSKPVAAWSMDETSGTTAPDTSERGSASLTFTEGTSWTNQGRLNGAVDLKRTTTGQTTAPVVDTLNNFSVSAWVRLDKDDAAAAVVGQPGTVMSSFQLYYSAYAKRWVFARYSADTTSGVTIGASSLKPPVLGAWTHLMGVYDQQAGQVRLYVNGQLQQVSPYTTPFAGSGPLQVGRWATGAARDYFPGAVDQLQVWNRTVHPDELGSEVNAKEEGTGRERPRLEAHWAMDETSGTVASDSSGNERPLTLAPGASFTSTGSLGRETVLGLSGAADASAGAAVPVDTSGSFTVAGWVDVTEDSRLEDTTIGHAATIIAHPGNQTSAFRVVYYQPKGQSDGYWILEMAENDVAGGPRTLLYSSLTEAPKGWVHVTATYDSVTGAARLFLGGVRQGDERGVLIKNTYQPGGLITAGKSRIYPTGAWGDTLLGQVDDLRVYTGAMSQQDITGLAFESQPPIDIE